MDSWPVFSEGSESKPTFHNGRYLNLNPRMLSLTTPNLAARFTRLGETVWRSIRYGLSDTTFSNTGVLRFPFYVEHSFAFASKLATAWSVSEWVRA
jgi:hypothetical protein